MPHYLYINPKTKEVVEIFQHMNDVHEYKKDGVEYIRVWTKPRMNVDSIPIDIYSESDFNRITNKNGSLGDLWDRSEELSQKRADKEGVDPVRQKFYKKYQKKHKGASHPQEKKEQSKKQLDDLGISVKFE